MYSFYATVNFHVSPLLVFPVPSTMQSTLQVYFPFPLAVIMTALSILLLAFWPRVAVGVLGGFPFTAEI